jgi:RNA recognition motif-containing protein
MDSNTSRKLSENVNKLLDKTGYTLLQSNGQRIYGGPPPNWEGPPPSRGSEVFVGKIPRNCFEDEIVPVFEEAGEIYELRLMMNFSGFNRGFGFVMFKSPETAVLAIKKLNNYEIRRGKRIVVVKSMDNFKLYIRGLPSDESESNIRSVSITVVAENKIHEIIRS